mgnify:CR=1 FL=1
MYFILTDVGQAAVQNLSTPPVLSLFKFGSGYNYTPISTQTDLNGSAVFTGTPSLPVVAGPNLLRYTAVVDSTVGQFAYGELGLFLPGGQLFAIGATSSLQYKDSGNGNNLVVDCFIPVTGANYDAYTAIANSAASLDVVVAGSIDSLPDAASAQTNIFIVPSRVMPNKASLVASALNGLWSLQGYVDGHATGVATSSGVTVSVSSWNTIPAIDPEFPGQLVFQATSGPNAGVLRSILSIVGSVITMENPFSSAMVAGNTFEIKAYVPSLTDLRTKQDALLDSGGTPLPAGAHVPTVAQANALIASALASIPAANLTGLVAKMATDSAGNNALSRVTSVFGTPLGRVLPS